MRWVGVFRRVLATDFCPWANRFVYWVKHPLACLALAAGVALTFAILLKPIASVVFAGLVFVLGLGIVWPWLALRGISAKFVFPTRRVSEGESVRVSVEITNRWPWPVWGLFLENLFPIEWRDVAGPFGQEIDEGQNVSLARVPGRSTSLFHWSLIPSSRGVFPQEQPLLSTGFPFGLWSWRRRLTTTNSLIVWPKTFAIETLLDAPQATPVEDRYCDHLTGDMGDMTGTRAFREGDSLRRVHWAQTARNDRMIVCERQASVVSHVELIADLSPEIHSVSGRNGSLEWTIRIFASLVKAWHAEHALVTCRWGNRTLVLSMGPGGIREFLDSMAEIPPEGQASEDFPNSLAGLQILITTDVGLGRQSLGQRCANHRRIVLSTAGDSVIDPARECCQVFLDEPEHVSTHFREQWRGLCHVG